MLSFTFSPSFEIHCFCEINISVFRPERDFIIQYFPSVHLLIILSDGHVSIQVTAKRFYYLFGPLSNKYVPACPLSWLVHSLSAPIL